MSEKSIEMIRVANHMRNSVRAGGFAIASGDDELVKKGVFSQRLFDEKKLEVIDEPTAMDQPGTSRAPAGHQPVTRDTIEGIAKRLHEEPELIPVEGYTGTGRIRVNALEEAFCRDFTMSERDEIEGLINELS